MHGATIKVKKKPLNVFVCSYNLGGRIELKVVVKL